MGIRVAKARSPRVLFLLFLPFMLVPDPSAAAEVPWQASGARETSSCPAGFSGPDCTFCSWESAGSACHPGSPREFFDLSAIKAMTLKDLGWKSTGSRHENGVTVYFGDWSGGTFLGYTPEGEPVDVPLREAAALYIPDGYPGTANPTLGLVYAAHGTDKVDGVVPANIARRFGMPVLYHGEYPNWLKAGYPTRGDINQATNGHLARVNACTPVDFVRGNFPLALARTDMLAITLLQRLVEVGGGAVQKVALRGFSKEGNAAWLAFLIDDRIEVGIPGGYHLEDRDQWVGFWEAALGCEPGSPRQQEIQGIVNGLEWRRRTPAGAAMKNRLGITENVPLFYPRVFLIDGDVGMYNMHDGSYNMSAGDESAFLDSFVSRPWRYVRKATVEAGADGEDGDETSTTAVPVLGAELLVAGPGSEARLYPDILQATAVLTGNRFVVTARATSIAQAARVWWTWSTDMEFNDVAQEPWRSVPMTASGGGVWTSPPIDVPPGTVVGWYAEVGNSATVGGSVSTRTHAAPIRFLRSTLPKDCEPAPRVSCSPSSWSLLLPVVLESAGVGGSRYSSEVTLASKLATSTEVTLVYTASIGSGSGSAKLTLAPLEQRVIPGILGFLRSQGLPIPDDGSSQVGTLLCTFSGADSGDEVFVGARTYTADPAGGAGTFGLFTPAAEAGAGPITIFGLQQNDAQRSNLAVVNTGASPVTVRIELFGPGGQSLGVLPDRTIGGLGWIQVGQPLAGKAASGRAIVTRVEGNSPISAYGVLNDAVTSDGSYLTPVLGDDFSGPDRLVPVVLDASGVGGARYRTELTLSNLTTSPLSLTLAYTAAPGFGSGSGEVPLTVLAGEQRIIPDAIAFLRATLPIETGGDVGGSLVVKAPSGIPTSAFAVGARTFVPAAPSGAYGLSYPGLTLDESADTVAWVNGLQQDERQRSNLAVVNRGDAGDSTTLRLTFTSPSGAVLGDPVEKTLAPGEWYQFNRPLEPFGVLAGSARIERVSGRSRFVAYGVLNDAVTSDGSYVPFSR